VSEDADVKLVAFIQMFNESSRGNLRRCLGNCKQWADDIVIYDDASTDDSVAVAREYTDHIIVGKENCFRRELYHKEELLEYALTLSPDWIFWIDCDEIEAMVMHIRINRGRGAIQAKKLSSLFKQITRSGRYDKGELKKLFAMSTDEMDLLYDGGLLKTRKLDQHVYSRAWVPIEAPKGAPTPTMSIERPPNADR
jgi:hypothetical protein